MKCYKGRSPDSSEHPGSFTPSFSYPLSRQSKRGGRLQPLRSARPLPRPGQFRRIKTSPALPNATARLHLNPRSCLASQTQLGTTMAGIPKSTEASLRRGARRRRLPTPPATLRPPEGPPRSGGSIPALGCPRRTSVRQRRSPDVPPLLGQRRGGSGD